METSRLSTFVCRWLISVSKMFPCYLIGFMGHSEGQNLLRVLEYLALEF